MRVRRVSDASAIEPALIASRNEVLPLSFTDSERPRVSRVMGANVAALDVGSELELGPLAVSGCRNDFVMTPHNGWVRALAEKYAQMTHRPVMHGDPSTIGSQLPLSAPRSVTWFCGEEETDLAKSIRVLRDTFIRRFGAPPRLGILAAENPADLTWMMAKQLFSSKESGEGTTIVINSESRFQPLPSAHHVEAGLSANDALAAIEEARGTLIILGHSRPHCGRLVFRDGELGICALRSGGADGRCVDSVVCHFGSRPRFVAQEARARRVYYDGCSTGKVGSSRHGLFGFPRESLMTYALMRSDAREFIGNVHAGAFGPSDIYWLMGLSALRYSPAECVQMIDLARAEAGRDALGSGAYFGDPTNAPWPACDTSIGTVSEHGATLRITWPRAAGVFVAKLPRRLWAELTARDLVDVRCEHPSNPQLSLIADPWSDTSVLLAIPRANLSGEPVCVEVSQLGTPVNREMGGDLVEAIANISWLATLPSFREQFSNATSTLERSLIQSRRSVEEREDRAWLGEIAQFARRAETVAAHCFDEMLIEHALVRSQTRWEFLEEYEGRCRFEFLKNSSQCPNCGASTRLAIFCDYARPNIRRSVATCSNCGVVADLPVWPLDLALDPSSMSWSDRILRGRARVVNRVEDAREVVVGATIVGGGKIEAGSTEPARIVIAPHSSTTFEFAITHAGPLTGTMRFRVFIASRSGFGFAGGIVLVQPQGTTGC